MRLTPLWIYKPASPPGQSVYVIWCVCYCRNWELGKLSLCRKGAEALCNVNEVGSEWHFQHNAGQLDVGNMYAPLWTTCHVSGFLMGKRRRSPKGKAEIMENVTIKAKLAANSELREEVLAKASAEPYYWELPGLPSLAMLAEGF